MIPAPIYFRNSLENKHLLRNEFLKKNKTIFPRSDENYFIIAFFFKKELQILSTF